MEPALNRLIKEYQTLNHLGRIGIVANQTSTTSTDFIPATEIIYTATQKTKGSSVTCVFGPQHGYFQTEQDNMKETPDSVYEFQDGKQVPLFSLYSQTREPTKEQVENIDTFVVDLQDIGCRIYTYMLTLAACLRSASQFHKNVVVLDRVNPLGLATRNSKKNWQYVEGNRLETKWHSFVGWYDIPLRHGLTMGELGKYFIKHDKLNLNYVVIPVDNFTRETSIEKLRYAKWTMPSPNIPSWFSAFFFPAFVSLEGTNVSEGRGSTVPFELIGTPWLNSKQCINFLKEKQNLFLYDTNKPSGLHMREHHFRPTFNKHMGHICHGIQFHLTEASNINIFALGLCFLYYCTRFHSTDFKWAQPGYEYNFTDLPINLIFGSDRWQRVLDKAKEQDCFPEFSSLLQTAEQEGQEFMGEMEHLLIYK